MATLVVQTLVGDWLVATVEGADGAYETRASAPGWGELLQRHASREEALAGHEATLAEVEELRRVGAGS